MSGLLVTGLTRPSNERRVGMDFHEFESAVFAARRAQMLRKGFRRSGWRPRARSPPGSPVN